MHEPPLWYFILLPSTFSSRFASSSSSLHRYRKPFFCLMAFILICTHDPLRKNFRLSSLQSTTISMCIYVCVYMYIYIESWNSSKSFFIGRFLDKGSNRVKDWPGGRNMISSGFVVVPWNFITQYCRAWKDVLNVFRLLRYKIASWYHISVNDALNRFPASIGILFDSKFSFFFFYKKKEINVIAFDTKKKIRDTIYINWIKSNDIYV